MQAAFAAEIYLFVAWLVGVPSQYLTKRVVLSRYLTQRQPFNWNLAESCRGKVILILWHTDTIASTYH